MLGYSYSNFFSICDPLGGIDLIKFMDDFVGAVIDNLKLIGYFLAGVLVVSAILYAFTGALNIITTLFY